MHTKNKATLVLILLCIVHLSLLIFTQFTAWPEMLTYPWLISKGFSFYGDIIHPYLPLLPYSLFTFYKLFGFSVLSLQLFTYIIILLTDYFIFSLNRKLFSLKWAAFSLALYIVLHILFEGNGLWFDLASIPLVLCSYNLLNSRIKLKYNWQVAGVFIGLAVLIKQTNILFLLPALATIKGRQNKFKFLILCFAPFFAVSLYFSLGPHLYDFWFWGVWFPITTLPNTPGFKLMPTLRQLLESILIFSPLILIPKKSLHKLSWFIIAAIFAFPRFAYFHLQPALAFFTLLFPLFFQSAGKTKRIFLVFYSVAVLFLFAKEIYSEKGSSVRFFNSNVISARQAITSTIPTGQTVYFYNVPSQYFILTSLLPSKPWADTFPWYLENTGLQEKIIENMVHTNYVVGTKITLNNTDVGLGTYTPRLVSAFIAEHFVLQKKITDSIFLYSRVR